MSDLRIERTFLAAPEKVFDYVTKTEHLVRWWGPEGLHVPEHNLDLSRKGSWYSVMVNAEGGRYKVSGEVLDIDPPNSVEFTWGWHDDEDKRGHESVVRFEIGPDGAGGTRLLMIHTNLADDESAASHDSGWTSTFKKLERLLS